MKKFTLGVVCGLLVGLILATTSLGLAASTIRLIINGEEIKPDVPPQIIKGRLMVPARFVAEPLGATVEWDGKTQTVKVTSSVKPSSSNNASGLDISSRPNTILQGEVATVFLNGSRQVMTPSARLKDTQVFVPVNFVVEKLKGQFQWIEPGKQFTLSWYYSDKVRYRISFTLGQKEVEITPSLPDGTLWHPYPSMLALPPYLEGEQVMVPLRMTVEDALQGRMEVTDLNTYITQIQAPEFQ